MLAYAANQLGLKPLVIDIYADIDTKNHAIKVWQTPDLSLKHLKPILTTISQQYPVKHILYGSGFEQHTDSLNYLETQFNLIGNTADIFKKIQNKRLFFNTLKQLNIPHPDTRFTPPETSENWLIKPKQGQGGIGIQYYKNQNNNTIYWQHYQTGSIHSVLFLADGKNINTVGFNTQWTTQEFLFSGIINDCSIPEEHKTKIITYLKKLTQRFKLRGLNSLDFIYHDKQVYILEINARIPASMQLYDPKILLSHIQNKLTAPKQNGYTAYQIIYAKQIFTIPNNIIWQENCVDIPENGQTIEIGQPICSMIEKALNAEKLLDLFRYVLLIN